MKAYERISKKSASLEEIPNLLPVNKVTPKVNKENAQVTQVHSSMEGKKILEKFSAIKEEKAKKEQAKKGNTSNNSKLMHSLNVRKNENVARMFVEQPSFKKAHVAIMF